MAKHELDKYYTHTELAKYCVEKTFEVLGSDWERIIEPSAGSGSYLDFLPKEITLSFDIAPEKDGIVEKNYLDVVLPYMERSLVIGNPPFGRANKLSVQFVIASLKHSDYISFIQPISQLNQNRTMKNTTLVYSEDLGAVKYSGRTVHCCLNIYQKSDEGKKDYSIDGIYGRHIFRQGKYKHTDDLLNFQWDFRVSAWGNIRLLRDGEFADNEIVFRTDNQKIKDWLGGELENCDYKELLSCVSSPNLPIWRLQKYLFEKFHV